MNQNILPCLSRVYSYKRENTNELAVDSKIGTGHSLFGLHIMVLIAGCDSLVHIFDM